MWAYHDRDARIAEPITHWMAQWLPDEEEAPLEERYMPLPINNQDAVELRVQMAEMTGFAGDLRDLFLKYGLERNYGCPTYILCRYIIDCLAAFENTQALIKKE